MSWQNIGQFVYNKVIIRRGTEMVLSVQVPGNFTRLTGLPQDSYTAHVIAVNQMGAESPEALLEFNIKAPPAPSKVDVTQGFFSVTLIPRLATLVNVSTQFDFWTSGETRLPNANTSTVEANATRAGMGTTWSSHELKAEHTYYWYIRTINAFGSSAFIEVAALCSMDSGDLNDLIDEAVRGSDAFQNVQNGVDTNLDGILQDALANHGTVSRQFEQYGAVRAEILTITTTIASVDQALSQLTTSVKSQFDGVNAQIIQQQTAIADNKKAISSLDSYVQAQIGPDGSLTSSVNQKMNAEVKSDGTAKASYTLNMGIVRNGVKYNTGFGMSIEPSGGTYKSTVVFAADQFGIYSGSDPGNYQAAFFVVNGQVFIKDALIQAASITSAKIAKAAIGSANITDYLQSDDYVAKNAGIRIGFRTGSIEINSTTPGQGGVIIDSTGIATFDENNIRRTKQGKIR